MASDRAVDTPPVGVYRVDPSASEITLSVKHLFGLATVRGRVSIASGEVVISDDPAASSVSVTASAASFDSGDVRRDRAVRSAKFLDVVQHPSLYFESLTTSADSGELLVAGVLTACGVRAPLQLVVSELRTEATGVLIRATGRVDRYDHEITAARGLAGRAVDLHITARVVARTSATTATP